MKDLAGHSRYAVLLLFGILFFILAFLQIRRGPEQYFDAAFAYQMVENVATRGIPTSQIQTVERYALIEQFIRALNERKVRRNTAGSRNVF